MELSQRVVKIEKMSHTKEEFIAISRIEGFQWMWILRISSTVEN